MEQITPFIVMDILARARKIPNAIHMEVGEPDLPPSPEVQEAFIKAIRDQRYFYTPACGLLELREKIAEHYNAVYGVNVTPDRIVITPGTSGAFLIVFALFSQRRSKIVLSDPSYPCYKNFSYFLQIEPHFVIVSKDTNYAISPDVIAGINNIGAIMVSSPANPTGSVYHADMFRQLISHCNERKMWFISDEIYHGLVYDTKEHTALEFSDDAIIINSFSKYFCLPGIRVGWMILPEQLVRPAEILVQNLFIAANTPAQYAAIEAFNYAYLKETCETFRKRRDFLYSELRGIFEIDAKPQGAFYLWADITKYSSDALAFCTDLLEKQEVAITPGIDFGSRWTDHVRFAYTRDIAELKEGVKRIKEFLEGNICELPRVIS
ncbi:MAG: aminotransferase class I/II-fold pyridoxal phosphate-dependent enzyme [Dissulfurispiraceae bacterium]